MPFYIFQDGDLSWLNIFSRNTNIVPNIFQAVCQSQLQRCTGISFINLQCKLTNLKKTAELLAQMIR